MDLCDFIVYFVHLLHYLFIVALIRAWHYILEPMMLNYSLLKFSRMVSTRGQGSGGDAPPPPPPPPEYMAGLVQQMGLNSQVLQGMLTQLQNQNQQQGVNIRDFVRLNPLPSTNLNSRLMLMTGSVTSLVNWSLLEWPLPNTSPLRHFS